MAELEQLIEKSTISLEHIGIVEIEDAEELLKHVSKQLPGTINYHTISYANITEAVKTKGSQQISGMISRNDKGYQSTVFSLAYDSYEEKFTNIKFQTTPGYDINEHSVSERKIWDDVRSIVKQYSVE